MDAVDQEVEVVTETVITQMMIIQITAMISTQMILVGETDTAAKLIQPIDRMVGTK